MKKVYLKIKRQHKPDAESYWEEFEVETTDNMTLKGALRLLAQKPVNALGEKTSAPVWQDDCAPDNCGACLVLVNGKPKSLCSTFIQQFKSPVTIEPLKKFPVVRDLLVDRSRMVISLERFRNHTVVDDLAPKPARTLLPDIDTDLENALSLCTSCGACLEVCPQYQKNSPFIGAIGIAQVLFWQNKHQSPSTQRQRLDEIMQPGGIEDCGHAQNCQKACPEKIPLLDMIAQMARQVTKHAFKKMLG